MLSVTTEGTPSPGVAVVDPWSLAHQLWGTESWAALQGSQRPQGAPGFQLGGPMADSPPGLALGSEGGHVCAKNLPQSINLHHAALADPPETHLPGF